MCDFVSASPSELLGVEVSDESSDELSTATPDRSNTPDCYTVVQPQSEPVVRPLPAKSLVKNEVIEHSD